MQLKVITPKGELSHLLVEEKPKSYKIISKNGTGIYRDVINKSWLNKPYVEYEYRMFLPYDCSDEEAIKIWNSKLDLISKQITEKYEHDKAELNSMFIKK